MPAPYLQVAKLPQRSGKQHAQKTLLMAWLNDPGFGERYMKMNESVRFSKSTAVSSGWRTARRNKIV